MDPETRALWNAVVTGKITREDSKAQIYIAAFREGIVEMETAMQAGADALCTAKGLLARLEGGQVP